MFRNSCIAIFVAAGLAAGCGAGDADRAGGGGASGASPASPNPGGMTPAERTGGAGGRVTMEALNADDQRFVQHAAMGNRMEVELGELAEDKAQNDQVQQLAERIKDDHERANQELQSMVSGDVMRASQPMPEHDQVRQKLEGLTDAAFDRAYVEEMIKHHEKDIAEFERAAQSSNEQVRAFAQKTLPTLRMHLEQSQQAQKQLGAGTGNQ